VSIPEKRVATSAEQQALTISPSVDVTGEHTPEKRRTRRVVLLRIASLAAVIVLLSVVAFKLGWFNVRHATATIERLQGGHNLLTVAVIFFVACALTTSVGFPALPFTVAGGAIFGHLLGATLSWAAALIGTMLGYALARFVGRETARRWLAKRAVGAALTQSTSFLTLLRLRLIPVVPLSVVNFAAGLARTRFSVYVAATAIGILPATIVFAYFADSLVRGLQGAKTHAYWDVGIASGGLLLLSLLPLLGRRGKSA
jgi:uncharacterized membrane protein YdjX (TVP38/TMEM64 family)